MNITPKMEITLYVTGDETDPEWLISGERFARLEIRVCPPNGNHGWCVSDWYSIDTFKRLKSGRWGAVPHYTSTGSGVDLPEWLRAKVRTAYAELVAGIPTTIPADEKGTEF